MNNTIKALVAVMVVALLIAGAWLYQSSRSDDAERTQTQSSVEPQKSALEQMYGSMHGDEFDEAYIADMIAHHEGAVNMAEQALAVSTRDEIRKLSEDIIRTQSQEIAQMHEWQRKWGYEATVSAGHAGHGMHDDMDMAHDMAAMQEKLDGLTGEAYDREFLVQMIEHHQQAVDMSRPAETNAKHDELKQLARDVISAQEREIEQMKQWQREWGY